MFKVDSSAIKAPPVCDVGNILINLLSVTCTLLDSEMCIACLILSTKFVLLMFKEPELIVTVP